LGGGFNKINLFNFFWGFWEFWGLNDAASAFTKFTWKFWSKLEARIFPPHFLARAKEFGKGFFFFFNLL
jgi:hypothetical protein